MKTKLLLFAGMGTIALGAAAQQLQEGYVTFPESGSLHTYIPAWNGGNGKITINNQEWEDEEFFISRVKPKTRFYNRQTQVYTTINDANDKRYVNWVPIGEPEYNAVPNALFDSDVFSMWSYVDHYGNWTSPYGWVPAAFSDIAHKNGVAVSGVASVPFGSISSGWRTCFTGMSGLSADAVGKFLYYHGVDGLGYNSEWSAYNPTGLAALHNSLKTYMAGKNPLFENMWYAGTTYSSGCSFDSRISTYKEIFEGSSLFLNYNWAGRSWFTNSEISKDIADMGKSSFLIYAGGDQEGDKTGGNFVALNNVNVSIGIWGSHRHNMFWQGRNANGSIPENQQRLYLNTCERWYTNWERNPAIRHAVNNAPGFRPYDGWCGISSMMSARSVLSWNVNTEPFYTFFNIGNGRFFNWHGNRVSDNPWYSIGIQDYLPTWRWWFAPSFMDGNVTAGSTNLAADFTWDDAYFGGSCVKVEGSTTEEYLHLFKTDFIVPNGKIRVAYKLLEGSADIELVTSNIEAPREVYMTYPMLTTAGSADAIDKTFNDGADSWSVVEFEVNAADYSSKKKMAVIALHFKNAKNMKLLLGELSVVKSSAYTTPAAPQITKSKVLSNNYSGVDGKIIWSMPNTKAVGEPVYNSDVKASMYKVYAREEGQEPVFLGATTSWAAIGFRAPNTDSGKKIQYGVSAVSLDTRNESAITWGELLDKGEYVTDENITINKNVIKTNESFELSYVDSNHAAATWTLTDDSGNEVWSGSGVTVVCPGLPSLGSYDLTVTCNGNTTEYPSYIAISSDAVGALPEIKTLSIGDKVVDETATSAPVEIKVNEPLTFAYTGRVADGAASRGIDLHEGLFGVNVGELQMESNKSFSVAFWTKLTSLPEPMANFITIEDRCGAGWPNRYWDYFWSRITPEGKFNGRLIETCWAMNMSGSDSGMRMHYGFNDTKLNLNAWTHIAVVFEYDNNANVRMKFYVNGVQQMVSYYSYLDKEAANTAIAKTGVGGDNGNWDRYDALAAAAGSNGGSNVLNPPMKPCQNPIGAARWISFGGNASSRSVAALDGVIDDFQVWGKAMTDEEVAASMAGLDGNNLPADVLGFWSLEDEPIVETVTLNIDGTSKNVDMYKFTGKVGANAKNKSPKAMRFNYIDDCAGVDGSEAPMFTSGSPFIPGEAFPIVTKPTWSTKRATVLGDGNDTEGSATIEWAKPGDYAVTLTLNNGHGEVSKDYPVVKVAETLSAIEGIGNDGAEFTTYTIDDALFVEFGADGEYSLEVYNMSGMLIASKQVAVVAGQNAQVSLANAGVYLVRVAKDGKLLRTVKVIRK